MCCLFNLDRMGCRKCWLGLLMGGPSVVSIHMGVDVEVEGSGCMGSRLLFK